MVVLNIKRCMLCGTNINPLFRIPKNNERFMAWLKNMGKESLLESHSQTYIYNNGRLCGAHFEDNCFTSTLKTRLNQTFAIPTLGIPTSAESNSSVTATELVSVESVPESSSDDSEWIDIEDPTTEDSINQSQVPLCSTPKSRPKSKFMQKTPKSKRIQQLIAKNYALQRKLNTFAKQAYGLESLKTLLTVEQYEFVLSQLKVAKLKDKRGSRWSAKEKAMAMNIYLRSPSAYSLLRERFAFPSKSTLRRSTGQIAKQDGICPIVLAALKDKAQKMTDLEKLCTIVFDEMSIKPWLTYNPTIDCVDGMESSNRKDGSPPQLATHALLFMLRGLTLNWKQAIAYYFTANTSPESWFMDTCYDVLCKVRDCGFTVVGTVCDQGPANKGLYRDLKVGPDVPYFFSGGMKIYSLNDMPHLIKNVRNNLRNYNIHFTDLKENRTMIASWKDIELFYEKDREQRFRVAPKLTYQHIYANGLPSMKVKLATQVFSHSVAAGLCVYASSGILGSSALETAEFVGTMNDLFDCMNSKQKYGKGFSSAISDDNGHAEFLKKCVKWVEGWKFMTPSGKIMKIPCQGGLVMTLNATLGIWDDLKKKNLSYLLTNRLNQDCVENAFSHIRRSGGLRDHPDCYQFRSSVRSVIVHEFLKKSNTNCEDDKDSNLLDLSKVHSSLANAITQAEEKNEEENTRDEFAPLFIDNMPVPTTTEIEDNVIFYIAGFVAKKYLKKSRCDQCKEALVSATKELDVNTMLVYFKEYDYESEDASFGLKWATDELFECMRDMGELFFRDIDNNIKKPGVRQIMSKIMENVDFDFIHHPHKDEAKQFIISSFITMMIKHKVRTLNGQNKIINESKKKKKKLSHVANV